MPFNIYSELSSSILAFMLIALTHSSAWVGERKGATIVNDRCPHSDGNEHIRAIECTTALLNPQLQSLAAVIRRCLMRHRPAGMSSRSCAQPTYRTIHMSSGPDFCAHALWNICHQFKGVWIWTVDREQVGISVSNATIHWRHCDWHKKTRALHETRSCLLRFT